MEPKGENFFTETIKFALLALLIVIPIRLFVFQPFIVSGASMEPTFETGEYLIVDQLSYRMHPPKRGEVIIFRFPQEPSKFFIKRVIGLPNETVELRGNTISIVNSEHPEGFSIDEPYLEGEPARNDFLTFGLKDDEYFVMGDNRGASSDSRVWGALPEHFIVGRALVRLYPPQKADVLPGNAATN